MAMMARVATRHWQESGALKEDGKKRGSHSLIMHHIGFMNTSRRQRTEEPEAVAAVLQDTSSRRQRPKKRRKGTRTSTGHMRADAVEGRDGSEGEGAHAQAGRPDGVDDDDVDDDVDYNDELVRHVRACADADGLAHTRQCTQVAGVLRSFARQARLTFPVDARLFFPCLHARRAHMRRLPLLAPAPSRPAQRTALTAVGGPRPRPAVAQRAGGTHTRTRARARDSCCCGLPLLSGIPLAAGRLALFCWARV